MYKLCDMYQYVFIVAGILDTLFHMINYFRIKVVISEITVIHERLKY